jgi:hypothetical protein
MSGEVIEDYPEDKYRRSILDEAAKRHKIRKNLKYVIMISVSYNHLNSDI